MAFAAPIPCTTRGPTLALGGVLGVAVSLLSRAAKSWLFCFLGGWSGGLGVSSAFFGSGLILTSGSGGTGAGSTSWNCGRGGADIVGCGISILGGVGGGGGAIAATLVLSVTVMRSTGMAWLSGLISSMRDQVK